MFKYCDALTTLDLSSFNVVNTHSLRHMFYQCPALRTIYVSYDWYMESHRLIGLFDHLFDGDKALVGGNGTVYDAGAYGLTSTDYIYAHIDTADTPGYFTYKKGTGAPEETTVSTTATTVTTTTTTKESTSSSSAATTTETTTETTVTTPAPDQPQYNSVVFDPETGFMTLYGNIDPNEVKEFANDIEGVVFEKGQFSPISNGAYYRVEVDDITREAVTRALEGEDYSAGALYFIQRSSASKSGSAWFDTLTFLFKYGCHEFYVE